MSLKWNERAQTSLTLVVFLYRLSGHVRLNGLNLVSSGRIIKGSSAVENRLNHAQVHMHFVHARFQTRHCIKKSNHLLLLWHLGFSCKILTLNLENLLSLELSLKASETVIGKTNYTESAFLLACKFPSSSGMRIVGPFIGCTSPPIVTSFGIF